MKTLHDYQVKIFLDSGNPIDTQEALRLYPGLAGQTTNPTLISKNPGIQAKLAEVKEITEETLLASYQDIALELNTLLPEGSISLEVPAREESTVKELLDYALEMNSWIPNAHIKFPITASGLGAAQEFAHQNGRVNMTLAFTLSQAQAVHIATAPADPGQVFYSSFVGRQYDNGRDGIQILRAVRALYDSWESNVEILAASFRSLEQIQAAVLAGANIITIPPKYLKEWSEQEFVVPETNKFITNSPSPSIPSEPVDWRNLNIEDDLTTAGLLKFQKDWEGLIRHAA